MTKSYGSATVLSEVSMTLRGGRVHALMGENGAGKSTLIRLIAGATPAEEGSVTVDGTPVRIASPHDAFEAGFRFIHQELNIVPQLTVAENILLGQRAPSRAGFFIDWKKMRATATAALAELGVDHIDARRQAGSLGTGDQMLIRIASALVREEGRAPPSLYVLDEPTAALSDTEAERLFEVIGRLTGQGAAVLYVSHRIEEVLRLADEATFLRNGRWVATEERAALDHDTVVRHITSRELGEIYPVRAAPLSGPPVLSFRDVGTRHLRGVSFDLRAGEILGVGGLEGAGQSELLLSLLGLEPVLSGKALFRDMPLPRSPSAAWRSGIAFVPRERRSQGLMMNMGVGANMLLPHLSGVFASRRDERRRTATLGAKVHLKADGAHQSVWQLSGGNQQKVVFGRGLAGAPDLLLLDEPTRGVDIGARREIYRLIRDLADAGTAVLLTSSELPEIIGMSDRVLVLQDGRQRDLIPTEGLGQDTLLARYFSQDKAIMHS